MALARPGVQNTDNVNCLVCGGRLEPQVVNICACETLPAIIVQNVPALVCVVCGEKVLSQDVMDVFARIGNGDAPLPDRQVSHVYNFNSVTAFSHPSVHVIWHGADSIEAGSLQSVKTLGSEQFYAEKTSTNDYITAPARV